MRKVGLMQKVVVRHPDDPDIAVTVRKLSRREQIEAANSSLEYQRVEVLHDADGEVMRDKKGNPQVYVHQRIPFPLMLETAAKIVLGWEGISDADGNPIPYSADKVEILFDDSLDVTVEKSDEYPDGHKSFYQLLTEASNDPSAFTEDPFVKR